MKNKLLIVTDLGLFKAFSVQMTPRRTVRLEPLAEFALEEGHQPFKSRVTDMAGRRAGPTRSWAGPMGDDHNFRLETRRRLIKRIAGHVAQLIRRDGEDGCWLAAPGTMDQPLLKELPAMIRQRIEKTVSLDLTKAQPQELVARFANGY